MTSTAARITDVETASFEREVIARSHERPVVVDFWATWCGPCRVLGPVLEAEVTALGGRVELVKVDTDRNAALARDFGIQGIPSVKAFRSGKVVNEFVGAKPATFVRGWLESLSPPPFEEALAEAGEALRQRKLDEAEKSLIPLLENDQTRDRAAVLLARVLLAAHRPAEVPPVLARVDARSEAAEAMPAIERMLSFSRDAQAFGGEGKARAAVLADPRDAAARWALASALAARGAIEEALDQFLELVTRHRKFNQDGARLAMLAIFDQLGSDDPLTSDFRRRLQVVL